MNWHKKTAEQWGKQWNERSCLQRNTFVNLGAKGQKRAYNHKFDKFDKKKLVNRRFSKNLCLYFILKFYRRNGWTFIQRLFCWIEFFKFSVEFRNRIWWLQFAHLVGKNSEKNHIFCQPYLWWGNSCSLGAAFSTMRLTLCSMKICYIRLPEIAHCCHARHSHQSDFVDNLFLLSPFSNRIKTTAILLLISVTDVFLCV